MRSVGRIAVMLTALLAVAPAGAVLPGEVLADPALEARARSLSTEIRCLICQNQNIDESDADLARDLRLLIRERLTAGDSDEATVAFLVARYGEFVLLRPRFSASTVLLWGAPVLFLLLGGAMAFSVVRRRAQSQPAAAALSADETRRVEALLADMDRREGKP